MYLSDEFEEALYKEISIEAEKKIEEYCCSTEFYNKVDAEVSRLFNDPIMCWGDNIDNHLVLEIVPTDMESSASVILDFEEYLFQSLDGREGEEKEILVRLEGIVSRVKKRLENQK